MDDWTGAGAHGFRHAALLYRTAEDFSTAALEFVHQGLEAGESVLVATASTASALLRARLDRKAGLLRLADLSRFGANPGRMLGAMRVFASEHQGKPVRCVQELYWQGRPLAEVREAMRLEALACEAMAGQPMSLLCAYDADLAPDLLARAELAHPTVRLDGRWRPGRAGTDATAGWSYNDESLAGPPAGAAELLFRREQASVRLFVAEQARRAGLAAHRVSDLVLAAGELAANTLAHTDGPGTLTMWVAGGSVICQVADTGLIADPLPGTLRPDPAATGRHRGLWLVQQVGDLVQIRSNPAAGTTIQVHMRLDG